MTGGVAGLVTGDVSEEGGGATDVAACRGSEESGGGVTVLQDRSRTDESRASALQDRMTPFFIAMPLSLESSESEDLSPTFS